MAVTISQVTITNVSPQVVPVLYDTIDLSKSVSTVGYNKSGQLLVPPGGNIKLETERVDLGQLDQFRRNGLITYVVA